MLFLVNHVHEKTSQWAKTNKILKVWLQFVIYTCFATLHSCCMIIDLFSANQKCVIFFHVHYSREKLCLGCSWELKHEMIFILFKLQITIYKDFKAFNILTLLITPKISLVILLTVCHTILVMLVWRISFWINL